MKPKSLSNIKHMGSYDQKRRWKFLLLAFALTIGGASLFYTNYLVKNLSVAERTRAQVWALSNKNIVLMQDINDEFITFIYSIRDSLSLPALVVNSKDQIIYWKGLDTTKTNNKQEAGKSKVYDPAYFKVQLAKMKEENDPIEITLPNKEKWTVYYKDSLLLKQLTAFPYIQLTVISIFFIVAYAVFSSSRRSEQDQVWVGLAKETAHQLGTPISSLMAWIELLKSKFNAENDPLLVEMEHDITRLEMVADRFSKIGSKPILKKEMIYRVIEDYIAYFKVRASNKINFLLNGDFKAEAIVNVPLFDWVLENLFKNAIDAIEGEGTIAVTVANHPLKNQVFIDVHDTGKGIPRFKFDTIFHPGYTTRKGGWGLGLSLAKRIIENYHKGHIFVKDSELGKGTNIRIVLKT